MRREAEARAPYELMTKDQLLEVMLDDPTPKLGGPGDRALSELQRRGDNEAEIKQAVARRANETRSLRHSWPFFEVEPCPRCGGITNPDGTCPKCPRED